MTCYWLNHHMHVHIFIYMYLIYLERRYSPWKLKYGIFCGLYATSLDFEDWKISKSSKSKIQSRNYFSPFLWSNLKKCPLNLWYWHLQTLLPYSLSCSLPFACWLHPEKSCPTPGEGVHPCFSQHLQTAESLWGICHQIILCGLLLTGIPSSSFSPFLLKMVVPALLSSS